MTSDDQDFDDTTAEADATGRRPFVVALAIDGLGVGLTPQSVSELVAVVTAAERAGVDFLTLRDSPGDPLGAAGPGGLATGMPLSAAETLAFAARKTNRIHLLSTGSSHYAEPFFTAKAIATLDYISEGRAGLLVDPVTSALADSRFPELAPLGGTELTDQAIEYTEVVRELWDSWEDDALVREVATGRYVDKHKIHHIDHAGTYFTVKGPLITPRPPQGQPPVVVRIGAPEAPAGGDGDSVSGVDALRLAAAVADIVLVAADNNDELRDLVERFLIEASVLGRSRAGLTIVASARVAAGSDIAGVVDTLRGLARGDGDPASGSAITPLVDGVELIAGDDLAAVVATFGTEAFATGGVVAGSWRASLGLQRPLSRYAL